MIDIANLKRLLSERTATQQRLADADMVGLDCDDTVLLEGINAQLRAAVPDLIAEVEHLTQVIKVCDDTASKLRDEIDRLRQLL